MAGNQQRVHFQPLTCIRQTGTRREPNGTTAYTFVAQVSRDLPPVTITLWVDPTPALSIGAIFDERARVEDPEADEHREGEVQLSLPVLEETAAPGTTSISVATAERSSLHEHIISAHPGGAYRPQTSHSDL